MQYLEAKEAERRWLDQVALQDQEHRGEARAAVARAAERDWLQAAADHNEERRQEAGAKILLEAEQRWKEQVAREDEERRREAITRAALAAELQWKNEVAQQDDERRKERDRLRRAEIERITEGSRPETVAGAQARRLGTFDDWSAYVIPASDWTKKICYALSRATSRLPDDFKSLPAYFLVSTQYAYRDKVTIVMNFDLKDNVGHNLLLAPKEFDLAVDNQTISRIFAITKNEDFSKLGENRQIQYIKNVSTNLKKRFLQPERLDTEYNLVQEMRKGREPFLTVKATSLHNEATADVYSLKGFDAALKAALRECTSS
jgi:hypothetical protein